MASLPPTVLPDHSFTHSRTPVLAPLMQSNSPGTDMSTTEHAPANQEEETDVEEEPSRADTPTAGEEAATPTQEIAKPVFLITKAQHGAATDESLSASPQIQTHADPSTPVTPSESVRDSMTSIALSESSLDYDHLSTEQVQDVLATPRASGVRRHLRKVSSLDILANNWAPPERQSTLFDSTDVSLHTPMSAMELQTDQSIWAPDDELSASTTHSNFSFGAVDKLDRSLSETSSTDGLYRRSDGSSSEEESQVDWQALDKNEEQEKEDKELPAGAEDESTAFLLARLEQENAKFAADPKSSAHKGPRARAGSRPPSMAHLKKLVSARDTPSIRYSLASDTGYAEEPPPMTELEFWAALVQDYPSTASRLPTLTTSKIRSGIPPPLRGVVWTSMSGARDKDLEEAFERLVGEKSPYEGIINKDVGRSFPGVELFRDAEGEGQKMLGRVLKCFSLHDKDIGYCQGLGFLVGPLLMNMGEREAFCVLVRLMDHYSLRPSFLPSLSGLHMRIYQFSSLLKQHHPKLHAHLADLGIEPAYLSQWFLSLFAVTCPLPMLFRIYDVIFAEGANETVMRVALALMRQHEQRMLATAEFEEVMQFLLNREMWDCYGSDPDQLVDDFTSIGDIVTHTRLAELEKEFEDQSSESVGQSAGFLPDVQAAASRFLGRLWAPGHTHTPSKPTPNAAHTPNPSVTTLSPQSAERDVPMSGYSFFGRPSGFLRRSPSKQSIGAVNESAGSEDSTSTAGSGSASYASTAPTEPDTPTASTMRESMADSMSLRSKPESMLPTAPSLHGRHTQDLHAQIEDLLTALSSMHREQAQLAAMLQREREDRSEDHRVMREIVGKLKKPGKDDRRRTMPAQFQTRAALGVSVKSRPLSVGGRSNSPLQPEKESPKDELEELLEKAQERLQINVRFSTSLETKAQLRSTLARTREQLTAAEAQSQELTIRLDSAEASVEAFNAESEDLRAEVKELRSRVNDDFKARQKLEHQLSEFRAQARSIGRKERLQRADSLTEVSTSGRTDSGVESRTRNGSVSSLPPGSVASSNGLRELKLGRRDSSSSVQSLRPVSRLLAPTQMEAAVASLRIPDGTISDSTSSACSSPAVVETAPPSSTTLSPTTALPASRTGFARRTTSLAAKEVLATPRHEPVPDEALLLELVNSKTSEAQAKQEVDELKRALAVSKRKQEEALAQFRVEMEAVKAEATAAQAAMQAAKAETQAVRLSQLATVGTPLFSNPPTPHTENLPSGTGSGKATPTSTPGDENVPDLHVAKKPDVTPVATGGGWFWSRRAPSKSDIVQIKDDAK